MGQHMNLEVIAERVETEEQWNILREPGCETFHGYYLSKPLNEMDFLNYLKHCIPCSNKISSNVMRSINEILLLLSIMSLKC